MRKVFVLICMVAFSVGLWGQQLNLIPEPVSVKQPKIAAMFHINPATQIVLQGTGLDKTADFLNDYLQQFYLFKLKIVKKASSNNAIILNDERIDNPVEGAYQMTVNNKGVYIAGDNAKGVFYGIQTLIQLLPVPDAKLKMRPAQLAIPYVSIEDAPRFAYRGMHLDVGRHFFPLSFIKKYIDYLAYHKFNSFHWHLTEDQGWRIEIKKHPKLTDIGAWRNGTIIGRYPGKGSDNKAYGGFYTQEDVKAIVKYAADRFIDVIPEIEMPGHASAAIAAYPELSCFPEKPTAIPANMISQKSKEEQAAGRVKLVQETWGVFDDVFCAGNEKTFTFLEEVLDEVIPLFPSKYFHVGGDESPKTHWKICPKCQQRIKELGLKDEHELQSYFIQRMEKYLNNKGRTLIGWDEILEGGLAPNAVVMSWQGEQGGIVAAKQNHNVIMTPGGWVYFDHTQSENEDSVTIGGYTPVQKTYGYEPVPAALNAEQAKYVLGAQANLWTEYIKYPSKVEYMVFPRMSALSEVLWSPKEKRDLPAFEKKLQTQFKRYDLWKANYSKAYYDLKATVIPSEENSGVQWKLETKQTTSQTFYKIHAANTKWTKTTEGNKYLKPITIKATGAVTAWNMVNGKALGTPVTQNFFFNKATGKKISLTNPPSKSYPGNGAFTLVDGVQNEKGLSKSKEFLGFNGSDCEAVIDFEIKTAINEIIIHTLAEPGSWIHFPAGVEIAISEDGQNFTSVNNAAIKTDEKRKITIKPNTVVNSRYIKLSIKNPGLIPAGQPGAGNKAWLFVNEIEVN